MQASNPYLDPIRTCKLETALSHLVTCFSQFYPNEEQSELTEYQKTDLLLFKSACRTISEQWGFSHQHIFVTVRVLYVAMLHSEIVAASNDNTLPSIHTHGYVLNFYPASIWLYKREGD